MIMFLIMFLYWEELYDYYGFGMINCVCAMYFRILLYIIYLNEYLFQFYTKT